MVTEALFTGGRNWKQPRASAANKQNVSCKADYCLPIENEICHLRHNRWNSISF